ncbi:MAG: SUMF1/EgtB/PvdO family nonheme iron enzyme [Alphaproteobacteria bacterium]
MPIQNRAKPSHDGATFDRLMNSRMKQALKVVFWLRWWAGIASLAFANLVSTAVSGAEGLDEIHVKAASDKSWGERLADLVGFGGFSKSYALVIGISDYEGSHADLPTANDAKRMAEYLFDEESFDYVRLLTEENVTKDRVSQLMDEEFPRLLDANDRFLFYWSGHGVTRAFAGDRGKAGYLPLHDTPPESWSRMIAMEDVQRWDRFLPARQSLFLLDACFGGLAGVVPQSSTPRDMRIDMLSQPGHHIMSAGTENEQTIALDSLGGSVFTTALLDGMQGEADAANGFERDGIVSLTELKSYVQNRVQHERNLAGWTSRITPQVRDLRVNSGEFFFLAKHAPRAVQSDTGSGAASAQAMGTEAAAPAVDNTVVAQAPVIRQEPDIMPLSSLEPLSTFRDCDQCPEMVVIPAGTFTMGSPAGEEGRKANEGPEHEVTFAAPFAIGKYEVTFAEWDACVDEGGCDYRPDDRGGGREDRPVISVSWEDTREYLAWLTEKTGHAYRLPSEAEWEYAARAGTTTRYWWGGQLEPDMANCGKACRDAWRATAPVGSFDANAYGLLDTVGNVAEWVEDRAQDSYKRAPGDGSVWDAGDGTARLLRGGSFVSGPAELRSASRKEAGPIIRNNAVGFRVVRSLAP